MLPKASRRLRKIRRSSPHANGQYPIGHQLLANLWQTYGSLLLRHKSEFGKFDHSEVPKSKFLIKVFESKCLAEIGMQKHFRLYKQNAAQLVESIAHCSMGSEIQELNRNPAQFFVCIQNRVKTRFRRFPQLCLQSLLIQQLSKHRCLHR